MATETQQLRSGFLVNKFLFGVGNKGKYNNK